MGNPATSWRRQGDIDVLYLGEVPVGRVSIPRTDKDKSHWLFNLAGATAFWRKEKSVDHARLALQLALNDWLRRAGLMDPTP